MDDPTGPGNKQPAKDWMAVEVFPPLQSAQGLIG